MDMKNNEDLDVHTGSTQIRWPNSTNKPFKEKTSLDYFILSYPSDSWTKSIHATNNMINEKYPESEHTTLGEIITYLGLRLGMCMDPIRGGYEAYWNTPDRNTSRQIMLPRDFGTRFGMTKNRFELLTTCFQLDFEEPIINNPNRVSIYFKQKYKNYSLINIFTVVYFG